MSLVRVSSAVQGSAAQGRTCKVGVDPKARSQTDRHVGKGTCRQHVSTKPAFAQQAGSWQTRGLPMMKVDTRELAAVAVIRLARVSSFPAAQPSEDRQAEDTGSGL